MGQERALGARSHSAPNPRHVFGSFWRVPKGTRPQAKPDLCPSRAMPGQAPPPEHQGFERFDAVRAELAWGAGGVRVRTPEREARTTIDAPVALIWVS